jgi:membrane protein YdbS with pleckstrin-like domain
VSPPHRLDSAVTDAAPVGEATPVAVEKPVVKLELLDGDEIIQFSIKPSLWFIPLVSAKWVITVGLLAAVLAVWMPGHWHLQATLVFQVLAAVAALRVGIASLQWASRYYVLTNRRVMRFKGVFTVDVAASPLARISRADRHATPYERALRLGSIHMDTADSNPGPILWENLAHPTQVHEALVRAIRKAQPKE